MTHPHHATRQLNVEQALCLLEEIEPLCRAAAARAEGRYSGHRVPWRTPSGSGVEGKTLYLVEDEWALSPTPCADAPRWPTVAAHIRSYWRSYRAVFAALDSTLPPCGCAGGVS